MRMHQDNSVITGLCAPEFLVLELNRPVLEVEISPFQMDELTPATTRLCQE